MKNTAFHCILPYIYSIRASSKTFNYLNKSSKLQNDQWPSFDRQAPASLDAESTGYCLLPACEQGTDGSLEHILLHCTALAVTRAKLYILCNTVAQESHLLSTVITSILNSDNNELKMQFILDSSVLSSVIRITQLYGVQTRDRLLYLGRTWCYNIHRERMKQMGHFSFR